MKNTLFAALAMLALSTLNSQFSTAFAQGTAFTYQGRLNLGGSPANGDYDFTFTLWSTNSGGSEIGGALTNAGVGVANGLFAVTLDFGSGIYTGQSCWLQVKVETNGVGPFVALTPRQPLTPTPYAVYAESSGGVTNASISAVQLNTVGAPASGQVLIFNGSSLEWTNPASGGSGWSLTGNDGAGDILGTTNNHPLNLVAGGFSAGMFWPLANGSVSVALGPNNYFTTFGNGGNFVAGGGSSPNLINADNSSIGGGYGNYIDYYSPGSVIAGGYFQRIGTFSGPSVIGGGAYNTISNSVSAGVIPGGQNNVVAGDYGFAAGFGAQALNTGAFVWADDSAGGAPFASTANNQFNVRALGGVRLVTGGAGMTIDGVPVTGGSGGGSGWSLLGNAGTSPANGDFLGTTDTNAFELHVNNARALRLEPGSGGYPNVIGGFYLNAVGSAFGGAFIGGGYGNSVNGYWSAIAGGLDNTANNYGDALGGGVQNMASGFEDTISGGENNTANENFSTVSGGFQNTATGNYSAVAGGNANLAAGDFSFAAGNSAVANNTGAFVWADDSGGSFTSTANNQFSVRAQGGVRFLTGGAGMTIDGVPVGTGGGGPGSTNGWLLTGNYNANPASGYFLGTLDSYPLELHVNGQRGLRLEYSGAYNQPNVIGGSSFNSVASGMSGATIGGGVENTNGGNYGTIGGGALNEIGTVGDATVAGGFENSATGNWATVGGGNGNTAGGADATVPGGYGNSANGNGSFAAGQNAHASYNGSFVWGDGSGGAYDNAPNEFQVLATGGVGLYTGTNNVNIVSSGALTFGSSTRQMIDLYTNGIYDYGIGVQTATLYERAGTGGGFAWYSGGVHNDGQDNNGGGTTLMTLDGSGNLGVNTATPQAALEVNGPIMLVDGEGGEQAYMGGTAAGDVYIGSLNPNITAISFENLGSLSPMHINCSSITIEGGSDLAEPFQIAPGQMDIPEGSVLVIDETNPGQLKRSDRPYDTCVAGVVSGANGIHPGIQMQQKGLLEGGKNVALTGRVYVQADASYGSIKPGDLLTSSATPGRAMKVSDHAKAQGAILGKAMTGLKNGQGMVLVLVTLQ
jgi:hypothetical protein